MHLGKGHNSDTWPNCYCTIGDLSLSGRSFTPLDPWDRIKGIKTYRYDDRNKSQLLGSALPSKLTKDTLAAWGLI